MEMLEADSKNYDFRVNKLRAGIFRDQGYSKVTAIVTSALGLKKGMGSKKFNDVRDADWFSGYKDSCRIWTYE